jgi:hypothetical protein
MNKLFCKALVAILTVSASGLMLDRTTLAGELSATKQPTSPLTDTEENYPLVDVEGELVPEVVLSDETPVSQLTAEPPIPDTEIEPALENPLDPESVEDSTAMEQVTSVSELADVQPTDWAFEALRSLVERYGCIEGYPNGTYQGLRAMTRYEFAAGLNRCLNRIQELITTLPSGVTQEDLAQLQRLQEEFATELTRLNSSVDSLETRVGTIEQQQFSTTTKLRGQVLTYVGDAFGENASDANNTAFGYRARLNLNTSFTGKDNLLIQLQAINLRRLNTATEFPDSRLSGTTDETRFLASSMTGNSDLILSALQYRFPVSDKLLVSLDAFSSDRILTEPINVLSSPATGAVSYFGAINPMLYPIGQRTGIGLQWKVTPWFNLDVSAGRENRVNDPEVGLLDGGYSVSVRSIFDFGPLDFSLTYIHLYTPESGVNTLSGSNAAKVQGAGPVVANVYVPALFYRVTPTLQVGGSIGLINARALGNGTRGDAQVLDYRLMLAFLDLGQKGNLGGIIFGMQPRLTGTSNPALAQAIGLPPGQRSDRDTGYHIEAFYTHRINDRIAITPGIFWLTAPNHDERNPDVFVGVIRTSFSF